MKPAVRDTLEALYAVLGDALGLSRESAATATGEVPAIVHDLDDNELRKAARDMQLAKPQAIGRYKRENLLKLFAAVDEADLLAYLEGRNADRDEVLAYLNDAELPLADIRKLAVSLGAMTAEKAERAQRRTAVAAIAAAGCSLEEVENAL